MKIYSTPGGLHGWWWLRLGNAGKKNLVDAIYPTIRSGEAYGTTEFGGTEYHLAEVCGSSISGFLVKAKESTDSGTAICNTNI